MGIAIKIMEKTSAGVRIAATTAMTNIATRRDLRMASAVRIPNSHEEKYDHRHLKNDSKRQTEKNDELNVARSPYQRLQFIPANPSRNPARRASRQKPQKRARRKRAAKQTR